VLARRRVLGSPSDSAGYVGSETVGSSLQLRLFEVGFVKSRVKVEWLSTGANYSDIDGRSDEC
jgi:hypothetical protein